MFAQNGNGVPAHVDGERSGARLRLHPDSDCAQCTTHALSLRRAARRWRVHRPSRCAPRLFTSLCPPRAAGRECFPNSNYKSDASTEKRFALADVPIYSNSQLAHKSGQAGHQR